VIALAPEKEIFSPSALFSGLSILKIRLAKGELNKASASLKKCLLMFQKTISKSLNSANARVIF